MCLNHMRATYICAFEFNICRNMPHGYGSAKIWWCVVSHQISNTRISSHTQHLLSKKVFLHTHSFSSEAGSPIIIYFRFFVECKMAIMSLVHFSKKLFRLDDFSNLVISAVLLIFSFYEVFLNLWFIIRIIYCNSYLKRSEKHFRSYNSL